MIHNQSLEQFYKRINKRILLVSSYLEDPFYDFLIRACRLKPISAMFGAKFDASKIVLDNVWIDEYGNSLDITGKRPRIILNDLSVDRSQLVSTDPYYGRAHAEIAKKSKLLYLLTGKDEDFLEDHFNLTLYGNDNYLRNYIYVYGRWSREYSPLTLGMKTLRTIWSNLDVKHFLNVKNKVEPVYPCIEVDAWISYCPVSRAFNSECLTNYEVVKSIFSGETK